MDNKELADKISALANEAKAAGKSSAAAVLSTIAGAVRLNQEHRIQEVTTPVAIKLRNEIIADLRLN